MDSGSPTPDGMRPEQVHLQFANLVARDANVAELADSGGDCVRDAILRNQRIHHRARPVDSRASVRGKKDGAALDCDFPHCFQREIVTVNVKSFHDAGFRFLNCQVPKTVHLLSRRFLKYFQNISPAAVRLSSLHP